MSARTQRLRRLDQGEVGVGTLIVFIAMVLVAAVAAAVLIGTSGTLQQRAQATGKEATAEVSSNLQVVGMHGQRNSTGTDIWNVRTYMTLAAGSQPVDMNQTIVRFSDGQTTRIYRHEDFESAGFTLSWVRGDGINSVARTGDLFELNFTLVDAELPPRSEFDLQILPAVGAAVQLVTKTPSTYGTDLYIDLQ